MTNKNTKKALFILVGLLSVLLLKLIFTYSINQVLIVNYNNQKYREDIISVLKLTNFNEPYIVYYNEGNIKNREKKYDEAIISYQKALQKNPPDKKKCDVLINISITMIQMINSTNKDEVLNKLKEARENLYNNHCADEQDNSGKSQDAENLEDEIREMEEEIQNGSGSGNNTTDNPDDNDDEETEEEKSLEKELEETNKKAKKNNQKDSEDNKNSSDYQIYTGKYW